jgi:hypothetical protein
MRDHLRSILGLAAASDQSRFMGYLGDLPQRHYLLHAFCTTKIKNKGNNSPERSRLGRAFVPSILKSRSL